MKKQKKLRKEELNECICSEYDEKGVSTCGFPCPLHSKPNPNTKDIVGSKGSTDDVSGRDIRKIKQDLKTLRKELGKDWKEEFDREFNCELLISCQMNPMDVKDFIDNLLQTQKQELIGKIKANKLDYGWGINAEEIINILK